ncbi:MAG TPA: M23 family metallopeptidase [Vicinamibacterales bacterium]
MTVRITVATLFMLAVIRADGAQATAPMRARTLQPGEVVVLTSIGDARSESVRVHAFKHWFPAYQEGEAWSAMIGIDLDTRPGTYQIEVESRVDGQIVHQSYPLQVQAKNFRTRRLTVNEAFVTPPKSEEARIEREAALLAETWTSTSAVRLWTTTFVRPVPQAANSAFGTRSIFNGKPRNSHGGADFLSPAGTPIHAPNAGRIAVARDLYFSGNTVIIDHGLGVFSTMAHLSRIDVREGDAVVPGQILGLVGATGRVTGPHLHWAVRVGDARVDPLSLLWAVGQERGKG